MISLTNSTIQNISNLTNSQNKSKINDNNPQTFLQKKRNVQAYSLFNSSYKTSIEESIFFIKNINEINKQYIEKKFKNEENIFNE